MDNNGISMNSFLLRIISYDEQLKKDRQVALNIKVPNIKNHKKIKT